MILVTSSDNSLDVVNSYDVVVNPSEAITYTAEAGFPEINLVPVNE